MIAFHLFVICVLLIEEPAAEFRGGITVPRDERSVTVIGPTTAGMETYGVGPKALREAVVQV